MSLTMHDVMTDADDMDADSRDNALAGHVRRLLAALGETLVVKLRYRMGS